MSDTRIGILSMAHVQSDIYAAALAGLADAELVGIADDDAERGRRFAEKHDTNHLETEDLLEAVDCVLVGAENTRHREWIEPAAEAGVAVLSEKPLATTMDEALTILDICGDANVDLGVLMPLRGSIAAREANRALSRGAIGSIQAIEGTNRSELLGDWFVDPKLAGGGAVVDHTVHLLDLVQWMTDERVVEVFAENDTLLSEIEVEDVNFLSMELSDGTQFLMDGSWSTPTEHDFWGDARLDLFGTEGVIKLDCFGQTFKRTRDPGGTAVTSTGHEQKETGVDRVYWGSDPYAVLMHDIVQSLESGDGLAPTATGTEGAEAVAVMEAAYESSRSNEPVEVAYGGVD